MASYLGTAGVDRFAGTDGADSFAFLIAYLAVTDVVTGGGGTDTLRFTAGGAIAASRFAGVRGVERIELFSTASVLVLDDAMVASATGARVNVFSDGADKVNGGALLAGHDVDVTALNGDDWLIGGAGDDTFRFQPRWLTFADKVEGGAGYDSLVVSGAGTTAAAALAGVSGIEQLILAADSIVTLDARFAAANAPVLAIRASAGNATVNAAALPATRAIDVTAGAGTHSLRGGAGDDIFRFDTGTLTREDLVAGGAGYDRLVFGAGGVVPYTAFRLMSGIEEVVLTQPGTKVQFDDAAVRDNAAVLTIRGSDGADRVNAAGVTDARHAFAFVAGGGDDYLAGGAGDDVFSFAAGQLTGADTVLGGGESTRCVSPARARRPPCRWRTCRGSSASCSPPAATA